MKVSNHPAPTRPGVPARSSTPALRSQTVSVAAAVLMAVEAEADGDDDGPGALMAPDARDASDARPSAPTHVWATLVDRPGPRRAGLPRLDVHAGEGWRRLVDREVRDLQALWQRMPESRFRTRQPAWTGDYQALKLRAAELVGLSNAIRNRERKVLDDIVRFGQALAEARRDLPVFADHAAAPVFSRAVRHAVRARFEGLWLAVGQAATDRLGQIASFGSPPHAALTGQLSAWLQRADALAIGLRTRQSDDVQVSTSERQIVQFLDEVRQMVAHQVPAPEARGSLAHPSAAGGGGHETLVQAVIDAARRLAERVGCWYDVDLLRWASPDFRADVVATWAAATEDRATGVLIEARVHALRLGGRHAPSGARNAFIETWVAAADQAAGELASPALHHALAGFASTVDPTRGPGREFSQAFVHIVLRYYRTTPVPEARGMTLQAITRQLVALPVALGTHDENEAWMQFLRAAIRRPLRGAVAREGDARLWLDAGDLARIEWQLAQTLGLPSSAPSIAPLTAPPVTLAVAPDLAPDLAAATARTLALPVVPPGGSGGPGVAKPAAALD